MPLNEKPHENFLRTPLSEAHKCDKCVRVGYIFYYEASQIQNINRMSGEVLSIVSELLPPTYWYRNDSVREASTTGIALMCNTFYCYCVIVQMTHYTDFTHLFSFFCLVNLFFIHHFMRSGPRVVMFL